MIRKPCLFAALWVAGPAEAHGSLGASADFYAGLAHPFLALEHLMLLLAAGLLLGRPFGPVTLLPVVCLAIGVGLGIAVGPRVSEGGVPLAVLVGGMLVGGLLAAAVAVTLPVRAMIGLAAGLVVGADSDVAVPAASEPLMILLPGFGVVMGAVLISVNLMALSSLARTAPWTIGVRIAGSWIAAASVLVLAVTLAGRAIPA